MKGSFCLSIIIHAAVICVLLAIFNAHHRAARPADPSSAPVDPAPVAEVSEEQLAQLDATIKALEQQKPEATQSTDSPAGQPDRTAPGETAAAAGSSPPATAPPAVADPVAGAPRPASPDAPFSKTDYASAGPPPLPVEPIAEVSLPRMAVTDPVAQKESLPAGEGRNPNGVRAPRAQFSDVRLADVTSLLAAHQAMVLIDLPDRTSYLFDAKAVTLCTSREQFLALADRAIPFPHSSRIAAALARDAAHPFKTQEGVEPGVLVNATVTLVWTNPIDAAILQAQRDAAAAEQIPFDHVAATQGSLELSDGRFSRYRVSRLQLTDDRVVPVKQ